MKLEKQKDGKHGNTLIISNAESADGGNYICKISANERIEVKHKVQIRGKNSFMSLKVVFRNEFNVYYLLLP